MQSLGFGYDPVALTKHEAIERRDGAEVCAGVRADITDAQIPLPGVELCDAITMHEDTILCMMHFVFLHSDGRHPRHLVDVRMQLNCHDLRKIHAHP